MKEVINWLYGPQTIGMVFLLFGFIQRTWPPKKVNGYYGYSSPATESSPEVWAEANRYAPVVMIRMGLGIILAGLIIMTAVRYITPLNAMWTQIGMFGNMAAALVGGMTMRNRTERHLKEKFGIDTE
ncbi:SdpI family protein [Mucilaginibacter myungsuensis]|uniref:SdpI family protein n=1 Tax=Mucilaginibacter myungsuensis TaxID=649104 RepID=A0A929KY38_9SPHI|nr:SdpI family protein [Mucilaginibacter myungsuensis]MBE9663297.1 SdpI family protein [Mucilaginibacter myungsuensis]MDN3600032.1 SdpI family protein [Mucilaginibacter myungsuensis]